MKKLLILILSVFLLAGCQGSSTSAGDMTCTPVSAGGSVYRCIDKDYGYICYVHNGIWCGKLEQ